MGKGGRLILGWNIANFERLSCCMILILPFEHMRDLGRSMK